MQNPEKSQLIEKYKGHANLYIRIANIEGFPTRSGNALIRVGVETTGQLLFLSEKRMVITHNVGLGSVPKIKALLEELDLELGVLHGAYTDRHNNNWLKHVPTVQQMGLILDNHPSTHKTYDYAAMQGGPN